MKKNMKRVFVILSIILVLLCLAFVYFYYFYVFEELRVCITGNSIDIEVPCDNNQACMDMVMQTLPNIKETLDKAPQFMKVKINETFSNALVCETTCKIKEISGTDLTTGETLKSCKPGDKEILQKVHGKELLQVYKFVKDNPNALEELPIGIPENPKIKNP